MNSIIPLQNSPERVSLLPIAPGVDFATAVALRRMATSTGATPAYLPGAGSERPPLVYA